MLKAGPCYPGHVPIRTMDPREDEERKGVTGNEKNEKGDSEWLLGVYGSFRSLEENCCAEYDDVKYQP